MVKRKQANKPGSSADASSTAVAGSSSMAQGAEAASAPRYAVSSKDGYRVPKLLKSPKAYFRSLWDLYEATFAISMLETWESIMLHCILIVLTYFIYWASANYLPDHIRQIAGRARYYLQGVGEA